MYSRETQTESLQRLRLALEHEVSCHGTGTTVVVAHTQQISESILFLNPTQKNLRCRKRRKEKKLDSFFVKRKSVKETTRVRRTHDIVLLLLLLLARRRTVRVRLEVLLLFVVVVVLVVSFSVSSFL